MYSKTTILILITATIALHASPPQPRCIAYPAAPFEWRVNGRADSSLRALAIYYLPDRGKMPQDHFITIGYLDADGIGWNTDVLCRNQAEKGITSCGIECDGGIFDHDEAYAIRVETLDLLRTEKDEEGNAGKSLIARKPKAWISGYEFPCPGDIPRLKIMDSKFYKDNPRGTWVCYQYKDRGHYTGCYRTTKSSRDLGDEHFGKYPDPKASEAAWKRCRGSVPKL